MEDGLRLEAPSVSGKAVARRATVRTYGAPLRVYAERYGYSERAIKRWVALGREMDPEDLPPLEDPLAMGEWWERMRAAGKLKWKVPDVFSMPPKKAASAPAGAEAEAVKVATATVAASDQGLGFSAALRRAQEAERLAHARWQAELGKDGDAFDPVAEKRRAEAWDRAAKLLESLEVKADKILGRDFVRMEEVEEVVAERESAIRDGIRSIGTRVCTKLNLPGELYAKVVESIDAEIDRVFAHLNGGENQIFELEA